MRRLLLPAIVGLCALPPAFAGTAAMSERTFEDKGIGFSLQPIAGWESKPKKPPDDPTALNEAGGWYSKDPAWPRTECTVLRFGTYFAEEARPVATTATGAPPAGKGGGDGGSDPSKPDGWTDPSKPGGGTDPAKPGDEPKKPEGPPPPRTAKELLGPGIKDFDEWIAVTSKGLKGRGVSFYLNPTEAKFGEDSGRLWEGQFIAGPSRILVYGASVRRGEFEVAVLYEAPDTKDFVRDLKGPFRSSTKSLRILPDKVMRKARDEMEKKLHGASAEEAFARKAIADLPPGWKASQTAHYVIVYDKTVDFTNPGLITRIGNQLEKLRAQVYEPLFPAARPVTALSIVKVTQNRAQYLAYGAPPSSAGYWSWLSRELVFYCDPKGQAGVDLTLDVLNHEGFHQYIFYAVGQVSPHSWFNEGHGDYFAGFNLDTSTGKFKPGKFAWRQPVIRAAIENKCWVPLEKFLQFSQPEYYRQGGDKAKGEDVGQNYAQGWSLIYFLRTTKDPRYTPILGRYFDTLKACVAAWRESEDAAAQKEGRAPAEITPPLEDDKASKAALKAAFEGVDIPQLERDWLASKPY